MIEETAISVRLNTMRSCANEVHNCNSGMDYFTPYHSMQPVG